MNVCVLVVAMLALVCAVATSFLAAGRDADRGRAGRGRRVSGRDGADRRSRADQPAPGGDRAPARRRAHRQRARRLDRRRDRRPVRLARRVRRARARSRSRSAILGVLRVPQRGDRRSRSRSTAPPSSPISAASSPTRAPRSASARCSWKRSSSTGCFPMSALLLLGIGETRASIAGLLIACFAIGGIVYSLAVPYLIGAVPERRLMLIGGVVAARAASRWSRCIFLAGADRGLRRVRARLLPAARLHPGPRHRPVADRARGGGVAAFVVVLSRPGDRPGDLWLRLRPWRAGADDHCSARWWCSASASSARGCCAAGPETARMNPRSTGPSISSAS